MLLIGHVLTPEGEAGLRAHADGEQVSEPGAPEMLAGDGDPLGLQQRLRLERTLGQPLDDLRIHRGAEADRLAASHGASGMALGRDIVLPERTLRRGPAFTELILAHEAAHAVQQRRRGGSSSTAAEGAANHAALAHALGRPAPHSRPRPCRRSPFWGNVTASRDTELPVVRPPWPVVSRRLYDVLSAVGPMPAHRYVPVHVEAVPGGETCDDLGILQLLEHEEAFDRQRSVLRDSPWFPGEVVDVEQLVVAPFEGRPVPAVFRLSAYTRPLLVSDAARQAIEAAGVRGCRFLEPERSL